MSSTQRCSLQQCKYMAKEHTSQWEVKQPSLIPHCKVRLIFKCRNLKHLWGTHRSSLKHPSRQLLSLPKNNHQNDERTHLQTPRKQLTKKADTAAQMSIPTRFPNAKVSSILRSKVFPQTSVDVQRIIIGIVTSQHPTQKVKSQENNVQKLRTWSQKKFRKIVFSVFKIDFCGKRVGFNAARSAHQSVSRATGKFLI